jgi:hypothetical protein
MFISHEETDCRENNFHRTTCRDILLFHLVYSVHCHRVTNLRDTNKCTILYFIRNIFLIYPTCFRVLSRHLEGADSKVSIKLTAIKELKIGVHTL